MRLRTTYSRTEIHENWRQVYRRHPAQIAFDNEIYDWLFRNLKPEGAWLDAGCGSGERTVQLARRAPAVLAVDISNEIQEAARELVGREGLDNRVRFLCAPLEELANLEPSNVHCRGVLMHIPDWRLSLDNLCRAVRPGGYLVLFESNCQSIEATIVRLAHYSQNRISKLVKGDDGLEFWSVRHGNPFLVRMANLDRIASHVMSHGFEVSRRKPVQLFDLNRLPAGWRGPMVWLNRLWFRLGLPFGSGEMLIARKKAKAS